MRQFHHLELHDEAGRPGTSFLYEKIPRRGCSSGSTVHEVLRRTDGKSVEGLLLPGDRAGAPPDLTKSRAGTWAGATPTQYTWRMPSATWAQGHCASLSRCYLHKGGAQARQGRAAGAGGVPGRRGSRGYRPREKWPTGGGLGRRDLLRDQGRRHRKKSNSYINEGQGVGRLSVGRHGCLTGWATWGRREQATLQALAEEPGKRADAAPGLLPGEVEGHEDPRRRVPGRTM